MKKLIVVMITVMMISTTTMAYAKGGSRGIDQELDIVADAAFARPIGVLSIIAGTVLFAISLPFALTSGRTDETARKFIINPVLFTFHRPLGEFDYSVDHHNNFY